MSLTAFAALLASAVVGPALPAAMDAALAACLAGQRWQADAGHLVATSAEAPGLPPGSLITRVPTAAGRLYAYQHDDRSRVIECGIAAYGSTPGIDVAALERRIASSDARLQPASPDAWRMTRRPGVQALYWAHGKESGVYGVMLLQAAPEPSGPTLQIDRHSVLVP